MNVLVTGGAGFIGGCFLRRLVPRFPAAHFINVDALTYAANLTSLASVEHAQNYVFEHVDITDREAVVGLFRRHAPDILVHFAAESHVDRSIHGPTAFVRTNVDGTLNLLEAARGHAHGDFLFHHVSTDEVYGSLGESGVFTEETRYDPSSPYSASKAASDHLVRAWARTYGLKVKITNCSNNYGPFQFPEKLIPLALLNLIERNPVPVYGRGLNVRDWLYVEDHCDAIWRVIESGRIGETYNIGGHNERRNIDVVHVLCRIVSEEMGVSCDELEALIEFVPDRPGHDRRYAIDATKLRKDCGWVPAETFETGLRKTVRWYLENGAWVERVRTGAYRDWLRTNYDRRAGRSR